MSIHFSVATSLTVNLLWNWWHLLDSGHLLLRSSTGSMPGSTSGNPFQLRLLFPYCGPMFGNLFINGTGSRRAVFWLVSPSAVLISSLLFSSPINRGTGVTYPKRISFKGWADYPEYLRSGKLGARWLLPTPQDCLPSLVVRFH